MTTPRRSRRKRFLLVVLVVAGSALVLLRCSFSASPLPEPPPLAGELPRASPPAQMRVFQLPTGTTQRNAGMAYRGGSFSDRRDFVMTAALVRHPKGDLLVDTGFGRDIDAQFQMLPWYFRAATRYEKARPAAEQLAAAGYDPKQLRAIVITHAHWDHVSGMADFPGTPVWVTAEERRFIDSSGWITAVARSQAGVRYEEYGFAGGPYLGFEKSHDVYGDGSIVIVPAPGHTPGSVIVFLTLPNGKRHALVGDLVWQREGILEREERPWLLRRIADSDAEGVRASLLKMTAIARRFPEINLAPAHDGRGFEPMERF